MIIVALAVLGLCLGSFVNALVWRVHEQETPKKGKKAQNLSIIKGRSLCPHCHHQLATKDLIPVLSWLSLGGKCRYCRKPISWQYPIVEILTAVLFAVSYYWWPQRLEGIEVASFLLWLVILIGLIALAVYDLRWRLLPNRILYPLSYVAGLYAVINVLSATSIISTLTSTILAVAVGGGIFYVLFQVSEGKWIGGGDVKLGWLLGLVVGSPAKSLLFIFVAAVLGSLMSLPLLYTKRLERSSTIPFGPFLIAGAIITVLFGGSILHWYTHSLFLF